MGAMLASSIMTVSNLRLENLESTKDLANVVATTRQVSDDCCSSSLSGIITLDGNSLVAGSLHGALRRFSFSARCNSCTSLELLSAVTCFSGMDPTNSLMLKNVTQAPELVEVRPIRPIP